MKTHQKTLSLLLALTLLSFMAACGLKGFDGQSVDPDSELAETNDVRDNLSVLDKGGANPTDNVSILEPDVTPPPVHHDNQNGDGLIDDLGDAASDVMEDVNDGLHDLTSPNPGSSSSLGDGTTSDGLNNGLPSNGLNNGAGNGTGAR